MSTLAALQAAQRLFREALPKFNWGASALDANAITLLNEVPDQVAKAIKALTWQPVTPQLLAELEAGRIGGRLWLATRGYGPLVGRYEWQQGTTPYVFVADTGARLPASWVTHVMPFNPPEMP